MGEGDACKLVIVVRTDLQMGKGKIAAQVDALCTLNTCLQGDHLSGKPGNVRELYRCQGNVKNFTKSHGNVREKSCHGKIKF